MSLIIYIQVEKAHNKDHLKSIFMELPGIYLYLLNWKLILDLKNQYFHFINCSIVFIIVSESGLLYNMDTLICWKTGKCIILLSLLFLRQNSLLLSTKFHKSRILWGKRGGWIPIYSSPAFSRRILSLLQPIIAILSLNCNAASMRTIQIII